MLKGSDEKLKQTYQDLDELRGEIKRVKMDLQNRELELDRVKAETSQEKVKLLKVGGLYDKGHSRNQTGKGEEIKDGGL